MKETIVDSWNAVMDNQHNPPAPPGPGVPALLYAGAGLDVEHGVQFGVPVYL